MPRESLTPGERLVALSLSLRPDQVATLRALARREGLSLSTVVRKAVDGEIARRLGPVPEPERVAV